ncbi:helix-turn-helix domain-containing protein [Paenibacillus sp. J5C_2022]|uniref:helix-turn-helix transcriptional regulator n=1 Tax=Paenibacillus sp. J5C2022 TaxID=2977129 RepID=UPI0021D3C378|nr:helix-turn-helix transcriptional regulator [Paenibacillus sp. J5C2022]MCU6709787.1 helix-turn-helix domain-containing protein [Paenibacillus sp. J5C2022]
MNGETVRAIRVYKDMTQPEMAELLKVSTSTISAVENGHRAVSRELRLRIAQTFGTGDDIMEAIARARDAERLAL